VNNFVQLAREGFYDNTTFHRVLDGFMAQAGDPTGTGRGGPGYRFEDEVDGGAALDRKGLLAMANSGPDSNGSQFFITFAETDFLTGLHTLFGEVTQGIEIVDAIELRDPASPTGPGQLVESITIIEIPSD
jgi:cyclophilin family peptidyl-prolyl cis-trans isomerase